VQRGIRIEYGKRLSAIEDTGAGVVCRFEDGTEAHGDVVLGADGLHSRARRFVDPMSPAPSYTGLLGVGGFAKAPALSPTLDTQHFVFGKRAFFGYLVKPSREVYWFANIAGPEPVPEQPARTTDEWKRELHTLFDGDGEIIHRILDAAVGAIGVHPVHDMPPLPTWRRGPVVLLGDAAHATSPSAGQGASQALEDAVVVAQCLRDIPDTATALATYERIRRERTERVVAYSRKLGSGKAPSGPVARWLRDLFLPFALKHFASPKAHAWLFTHHIDWDANIVTG
jgi:2-polyprenyl-6-methoxyphenol hydroxylase-like FAD-dependent oxidoreductase